MLAGTLPAGGKDFFAAAVAPRDMIHFTICCKSVADIAGCADIAASPHTPLPPRCIFSTRYAVAFGSVLYLSATCIKAGPIDFSFSLWQDLQSLVSIVFLPIIVSETDKCPIGTAALSVPSTKSAM